MARISPQETCVCLADTWGAAGNGLHGAHKLRQRLSGTGPLLGTYLGHILQ